MWSGPADAGLEGPHRPPRPDHRVSARAIQNRLSVSPTSPLVPRASTLCRPPRALPLLLHPNGSSPHVEAAAGSTPPTMSGLIPIAALVAGSVSAIGLASGL